MVFHRGESRLWGEGKVFQGRLHLKEKGEPHKELPLR
jgi:hypothetical protein